MYIDSNGHDAIQCAESNEHGQPDGQNSASLESLPPSVPLDADALTKVNGTDHNSQSSLNAPPGFEEVRFTQSYPQEKMESKRMRVVRGQLVERRKLL